MPSSARNNDAPRRSAGNRRGRRRFRFRTSRRARTRKNYLFAGSHEAAHRAANLYSLTRTCAQYQIPPLPYLTDVLSKLAAGWRMAHLDELLPPRWCLSELPALHASRPVVPTPDHATAPLRAYPWSGRTLTARRRSKAGSSANSRWVRQLAAIQRCWQAYGGLEAEDGRIRVSYSANEGLLALGERGPRVGLPGQPGSPWPGQTTRSTSTGKATERLG